MCEFRKRLKEGVVLLDGGMGTMVQDILAPGENPALLSIRAPEQVEAVHRAYFQAGADVVYTNTFGAGVLKLEGSGYTTEEITAASVAAARRAAAPFGGLVALDVGPLGELLEPLGTLPFDRAVELYIRQIRAGVEAGVDLIAIETIMDIYEAKAALLAARTVTQELPVLVTMTFEESGRTFTGCTVPVMALTLESLGADAIGINCSVGPDRLRDIVSQLRRWTKLPIVAKPNAGMPRPQGGYDLTAEEFAAGVAELSRLGACVVGGCCGTTPEHIRLVKELVGYVHPAPAPEETPCAVCSGLTAVELGKSPVVVGERLNPTGKKRLKQALLEGDMDYIMAQAVQQEEDGAQILDVNVGLPGLNEAEMMPRVIRAVQSVSTLPIQIDSSDPAAIEAGLRAVNGRAIVNSVNGEPASLEAVLPLVKRYGAVVIGLTLDENGIPETAEGRTAIARRILERCDSLGIPRRDVVMDCVTMPVGSDPNSGAVTLAAVSAVHAMGVKTSLGVSNVSFGLPRRDVLNRTFYAMALGSGLDLAILNPGDVGMMETVCSYRLLSGWDEGGQNYVDRFAGTTAPVAVAAATAAPGAPEKKSADPLTDAVLAGLAEGAAQAAEQMLREMEPQELIDKAIIPVLDEVGRRYEAGTLFLPQLMRSADAAKAACDVVRQVLASKGSVPDGEPIVIATVKGDIHDIGKNIVRAVLENYGYRIIDLGRDVPPETVVKAVRESGARLCGLSALMTTTVPSMEETIRQLRESCPDCRVMVGGAVLTADWAEKAGADYYVKDAAASVQAARDCLGK